MVASHICWQLARVRVYAERLRLLDGQRDQRFRAHHRPQFAHSQHVEVQNPQYCAQLLARQLRDVVLAAQQPGLLRAEQREAHALGVPVRSQHTRDLQRHRRARGVVVGARARRHAVHVSADNHPALSGVLRLRDHVQRLALAGDRLDAHRHAHRASRRQEAQRLAVVV